MPSPTTKTKIIESRRYKMPVVVGTNATATASSFNLSRANDALRKSLERLSTGKRINSAADDGVSIRRLQAEF